MVGSGNGAKWKRRVLSKAIPFDDLDTHTAAMNLAFAEVLGIARHHEISIGWTTQDAARASALLGERTRASPYVVLHVHPKFNYKMWHVEGWVGLAHWLGERGYDTVLTGGAEPGEREFVATVAARMPQGVVNLAGQLTIAQTACVIAGARLFVGPDTVTTHLAAALGVPTVALYGPSNPVKWGPWPRRFAGAPSPWQRVGTQAMGNVQLVQGAGACVPCLGEGCDRHVASFSDCLQQLPLSVVIAAAERAMAKDAA
jgi:heptosyltransferase-3